MLIRRSVISLVTFAAIVGITAFIIFCKHEHEFTATISYAHFMAKTLQIYVGDNREYPETLGAMIKAETTDTDSSFLRPPFGSMVSYRRPATNAPDDTPILIVTYRKREIVVTKDFTRRP